MQNEQHLNAKHLAMSISSAIYIINNAIYKIVHHPLYFY